MSESEYFTFVFFTDFSTMHHEGRKTALLQILVVGQPVRFANVLLWAGYLNCPEGQKRAGKN